MTHSKGALGSTLLMNLPLINALFVWASVRHAAGAGNFDFLGGCDNELAADNFGQRDYLYRVQRRSGLCLAPGAHRLFRHAAQRHQHAAGKADESADQAHPADEIYPVPHSAGLHDIQRV